MDTLNNLKIKLQLEIDDTSLDNYLNQLLDQSKLIVLNEYYGANEVDESSVIPYRYRYIVLDVAAFLFNKTGVEGQTGHTEQGINRQYGTSGVPAEFFANMSRKVKVFNI